MSHAFPKLKTITKHPKIVIIGGGFGGLTLLNELKDSQFDVTLIDKNNFHTFQPLLYQVATASLSADSIGYPFRRTISLHKNQRFLMAEVHKILPEQKSVETSAGKVSYDFLVLATGSVTNFFGNAEIAKHAMKLKSISQALDIRSAFLQDFEKATQLTQQKDQRQVEKVLNFVIVGAGPTGVEVAGALAEIKNNILSKEYREIDARLMRITLLDGGSRILAAMSERSSQKAHDYLTHLGVKIRTNALVTSYNGDLLTLAGDGGEIATNTVIWAAGVKANTPPGLAPASTAKNGRYLVDNFNVVTAYSDIFAIGDVAQMATERYPNGHPMMAQPAIQQAKNLAANFKATLRKKPAKKFVYNNKGSMATIGRNRAVVEMGKVKISGWLAWYIWMIVHVLFLIGFRNRIVVLFNWAVKYFSYKNTIRLIIRPFKT